MNRRFVSVLALVALTATAAAQESTSLNRSEVASIKAKLVAIQQAMGTEPAGYIKGEEDSFYLPTDFNPAADGRFWPITSSVQMQFTDRGAVESAADIEKMQAEFQAKYAAALASGSPDAIANMIEEMTRMQTAAVAAAMAPAAKKEDLRVDVQLNMNPSVGIDPDAVVLERPGVIALRRKDDATGATGEVMVYIDPVALARTEELAKVELRTASDGVTNRSGVFHVVIRLDGSLPDIESWVGSFDYPAMLTVFDSQ